MREILFCGKRTDTGEWVRGWYAQKENPHSLDGKPVRHLIADLPPFGYEVDPKTVGQFTGRLDKNGKRVFEGDVLDFFSGEYRGVVLWSDHDQCYIISPDGDENHHLGDFGNYGKPEYFEVVGNIHDSQELLLEVKNNG